jgi:2-oxoglutarate ferredoxin oxidoreductase subunit alpha
MGEKFLMKGNEALGEAAIIAGCEAYFGYPITPQNELTAYMSKRMLEEGRVFVQSESELAAVNMVFGAAGAGKRTMTSSSSPGVSLKQEGISYLAGARLPAVIVNVMRGGPGLGNISPAQGDYYQATRGGGNGDYRLIVFAPNSVQEMADDVIDAFYLADKYRMPSMVMADGMLGQMMEPVVFKEPKGNKGLPPKDWALTGAKGRPRNIVRSLMLGGTGLYEHNEVLRKIYAEVEANEIRYEELETADADVTLVAYGSASRACIGAVRHLRAAGKKVGLIRPRLVWPYPYKVLEKQAEKSKKFLVVEMNLGQMLDDVRIGVAGKAPVGFYGYAGGWIPTVKEVVDRVNQMF